MITLTIPGKPIAWKRPENKAGGGRRDSQKQEKADFALKCLAQVKIDKLLDLPLRMVVTVYLEGDIGFDGDYYTNVPDASNCLKFVEDALEGTYYSNDKYIVDSRCIKRFGTPRTVVEIYDAEYKE